MAIATRFQELRAWQNSIELAMRIFELSKRFPVEERYSLTDQVRRSTRSVAANISEAWRKRRYEGAFISKLNDAETEVAESQTWIEIARRCGYLDDPTASELMAEAEEILSQLALMIRDANRWCEGFLR
jgi:four helix bundle protein